MLDTRTYISFSAYIFCYMLHCPNVLLREIFKWKYRDTVTGYTCAHCRVISGGVDVNREGYLLLHCPAPLLLVKCAAQVHTNHTFTDVYWVCLNVTQQRWTPIDILVSHGVVLHYFIFTRKDAIHTCSLYCFRCIIVMRNVNMFCFLLFSVYT